MPHNKNHTRDQAKEKLKNGIVFRGEQVLINHYHNSNGERIDFDVPKVGLSDEEAEQYIQYQEKYEKMTWKEG